MYESFPPRAPALYWHLSCSHSRMQSAGERERPPRQAPTAVSAAESESSSENLRIPQVANIPATLSRKHAAGVRPFDCAFVQIYIHSMPPRPVSNPPNPWHRTTLEWLEPSPPARLQIFEDATRSILAHNDSPDIGFRWSVNPYRGCTHACAYCYARPWHEYLDFGAGTDFDRKIVVKPNAPALLAEAFDRPAWRGELIVFSGVTDCYQPLEAAYDLTGRCLEVCRDYRNPVAIITKSPLIERDLARLVELNAVADVRIVVSIPLADRRFARALEPQVASPERRIETIARLRSAGLNVGMNLAPYLPVLSDEGLPRLLDSAAEAGAQWVGFTFLRLRGSVADVFVERLREQLPSHAEHVLSRIRDARGGALDDPRFGHRMQGDGPYAEASRALVEVAARRAGLRVGTFDTPPRQTFRRPPRRSAGEQLSLL